MCISKLTNYLLYRINKESDWELDVISYDQEARLTMTRKAIAKTWEKNKPKYDAK
jgi:hypothetical protein